MGSVIQDRKEDYLLRATILIDGRSFENVSCKLFLPERIQDKPYCRLYPEGEAAQSITRSFSGSIKAINDSAGVSAVSFESPKAYFSNAVTNYRSSGVSETTVYCEPQDLHVSQNIQGSGNTTSFVFWISPNKLLSPAIVRTDSYLGDAQKERIHNPKFQLKNGLDVELDRHFRSKYLDNGDKLEWSFQVLTFDISGMYAKNVAHIKEEYLPLIDDFLLVASFVARSRTACVGWSAADAVSMGTLYRGDYTFPDFLDSKNSNNELIDLSKADIFIQKCFDGFHVFENKESLRHALYAAVGSHSETLELSFLHLFSGLESLILQFRREMGVEFILGENDWKDFRKYMEKSIKSCDKPILSKGQRSSIYNKLGELNRISLSEAFSLFCAHYSLDISDLWPVFSDIKNAASLADVRNRLIHGDPFPDELLHSVMVANENLRYVLERALVRILGCSVEETKVDSPYLKNSIAIQEVNSAREIISQHIYGSQ